MGRLSLNRAIGVVGLSILGLVFLCWASEQLEEARLRHSGVATPGLVDHADRIRSNPWCAAGLARAGSSQSNTAATLVVGLCLWL